MKLNAAMILFLLPFTLATPAGETPDWPAIEGAQSPREVWLISGQPEPHEVVEAATAGARHVVNVRDIGEFDAWDEGALVEALDLQYHRVPIGGPDDLDRGAVEAFDDILTTIGDDPALMHCSSGNRIGALFALRAGWLQGKEVEEAVSIGKAHGLTRLETAVRQRLNAN